MPERFRPLVAVFAILLRDGKIFMLRRYETGWKDGEFTLPSGHIEGGETLVAAAVRETKEEAGVEVLPEDFKAAHLTHFIHGREYEYLNIYFVTEKWIGEPRLMEEDKADEAEWFPVDQIPDSAINSVKAAVENYRRGIFYSEFGWDGEI